jgi:hypothetical protein
MLRYRDFDVDHPDYIPAVLGTYSSDLGDGAAADGLGTGTTADFLGSRFAEHLSEQELDGPAGGEAV